MEVFKPLHDSYAWFLMNRTSPGGHLNASAQQIVERMRQNAAARAARTWEQVHDLTHMIEQKELRGQAAAEAWVECGLAAYHMGDCDRAVEFLNEALTLYQFYNHHYAAVQWMRGYILWQTDDRHKDARCAWQDAIDKFDGLNKFPILPEADPKWYLARWKEMTELLKVAIEQDGKNLFDTPAAAEHAAPRKVKASPRHKRARASSTARLRIYKTSGPIPAGMPKPVEAAANDQAYIEMESVLIDEEPHAVFSLGKSKIVNLISSKKRYVLEVTGDSMNRASPVPIDVGDYVLLVMQEAADDNDIVAAEIENEDRQATLKRYNKTGNSVYLRPESTNPIHQEWQFPGSSRYHIRGVALAVFKPIQDDPGRAAQAAESLPPEWKDAPEPVDPRYADLLAKAKGDTDLAERMIEFERRAYPKASRHDLIERAIERWEHDNR